MYYDFLVGRTQHRQKKVVIGINIAYLWLLKLCLERTRTEPRGTGRTGRSTCHRHRSALLLNPENPENMCVPQDRGSKSNPHQKKIPGSDSFAESAALLFSVLIGKMACFVWNEIFVHNWIYYLYYSHFSQFSV